MQIFDGLYKAVIGIVFLLDIMLLIFSSGKMGKFLNSIFSVFLFICLSLPIISLFTIDNRTLVEQVSINDDFIIDYNFTQSIDEYVINKNAKSMENYAKNYLKCQIVVNYSTKIIENHCSVDKIVIEIIDTGITDETLHNNLIDDLATVAQSIFCVDASQVKVYEKI